jgi:hypothetical protein
MFKALREAYSEIQNTREEVQKRYDEFDMEKWALLSIDALISKFPYPTSTLWGVRTTSGQLVWFEVRTSARKCHHQTRRITTFGITSDSASAQDGRGHGASSGAPSLRGGR